MDSVRVLLKKKLKERKKKQTRLYVALHFNLSLLEQFMKDLKVEMIPAVE